MDQVLPTTGMPRRAARVRRPWLVGLEAVSLALLAVGLCHAAGRIAPVLDEPGALALSLCGVALGLLAADLASGLGHWLCDTCFREDTPVLGALLIRSFRAHHRAPDEIVGHGFLELNGESALVLLPVVGAASLARGPETGAGALVAHAAVVGLAVAIGLTNSLHRFAHAPRAPRAIAWLQSRGVLLSPAAHAVHHAGDHGRAYCITLGWWNPLLDRVGVFRALERALDRLDRRPRRAGCGLTVRRRSRSPCRPRR